MTGVGFTRNNKNFEIFIDRILNPQLHALGSKDEVDAEAYDRFCNKQDRAFSVQGGVDLTFNLTLK
jgi:hypothetical protein